MIDILSTFLAFIMVVQTQYPGQNIYTKWTGYSYISDLLQLPTDTPFKIRHIGGQYLYTNHGSVDPGRSYNVHGTCSLDPNRALNAYWIIETKLNWKDYSGFPDSWCGEDVDITSYRFKNTYSSNYPSICSDDSTDIFMYTSPACGTKDWLNIDCSGNLKVVNLYGNIYPRYYSQLMIITDSYSTPPQLLKYCPSIDLCYASNEEILVYSSCGLNDFSDALFTFEVSDSVDLTINNDAGPIHFYEGYSYLSDLSVGDIIVIRLISGAYYDNTNGGGGNFIYTRCYYAWENQKWILRQNNGYYNFQNAETNKYLCKKSVGRPANILISRSWLTSDCNFNGRQFAYGDKKYTRLTVTSGSQKFCIDTSETHFSQCDDTIPITLSTNCRGGVYFEKV